MEAGFNLLWLLTALGALAFWHVRGLRPEGSCRLQVLPRLIALGCLLVLLFPVISLTDDLHCKVAVAEECSRSGYSSTKISSETAHRGKWGGPPAAVFLGQSLFFHRAVFEILIPLVVCLKHLTLSDPAEGRSPPITPSSNTRANTNL
jgi:hypothetical protein